MLKGGQPQLGLLCCLRLQSLYILCLAAKDHDASNSTGQACTHSVKNTLFRLGYHVSALNMLQLRLHNNLEQSTLMQLQPK
jgi:hypothetical protein